MSGFQARWYTFLKHAVLFVLGCYGISMVFAALGPLWILDVPVAALIILPFALLYTVLPYAAVLVLIKTRTAGQLPYYALLGLIAPVVVYFMLDERYFLFLAIGGPIFGVIYGLLDRRVVVTAPGETAVVGAAAADGDNAGQNR
jgi:hypothetical protein